MRSLLLFLLWAVPAALAAGPEVIVRTPAELRAALPGLADGATLRIGPGEYPGGNAVSGVGGLTVEALDPANPPLFRGASEAWHFTRCERLTVRHLRAAGQTGNGFNLDDGGRLDEPVRGVTLENLDVADIGPQGNKDGIKASGLDGLVIRGCRIAGWGGQGIDLVGCHDTLITGCTLTGKPGYSASAGVQLKGGCERVTVEKCLFVNAGDRPLNLGGSTGLEYFRPRGARFEARRVTARDNEIRGGTCAAAFVGVDGAVFERNLILFPDKWIFRILQETRADGFPPCRNVVVRDNRVVFRRAAVAVDVNIGPHTAPDTFRFEGNAWFAEDRPGASKPTLPVPETGATHGADPRPRKENP